MRERLEDWTEADLDSVERQLKRRIQQDGALDVYGYCLQAIRTIRAEKPEPPSPEKYLMVQCPFCKAGVNHPCITETEGAVHFARAHRWQDVNL